MPRQLAIRVTTNCKWCAEEIYAEALYCKHCGRSQLETPPEVSRIRAYRRDLALGLSAGLVILVAVGLAILMLGARVYPVAWISLIVGVIALIVLIYAIFR